MKIENNINTTTGKIIAVIVAITVVVIIILALTGHLGPITFDPNAPNTP
jgi:hypothetical protein